MSTIRESLDDSELHNSPACLSLLETSTQQISIQLDCSSELVHDFVNYSLMAARPCLLPDSSEEDAYRRRPQRVPSEQLIPETDLDQEYDIETKCDCENTLSRDLEESKQVNIELISEIDSLHREIDDLRRRISITTEENFEYREQYSAQEREIEGLRNKNAYLEKEKETIVEQYEEQLKKLSSKPVMVHKAAEARQLESVAAPKAVSENHLFESTCVEVADETQASTSSRFKHTPLASTLSEDPLAKRLSFDEKSTPVYQSAVIKAKELDMPLIASKPVPPEDHFVQRQKARHNKQRNLSSNIFVFEDSERSPVKTPTKSCTYTEVEIENQEQLNIGQRKCSRRTPTRTAGVDAEQQTKAPLAASHVANLPTIADVEYELQGLLSSREALNSELRKIDFMRLKTGDIMRQRNKKVEEVEVLDAQIQSLKSKIRRSAMKRQ